MAIRNPFKTIDKTQDKTNATPIVDHGLGEAYEVVEFVKNNIGLINTFVAMSDQFNTITDNIANFGNYALIDHNHNFAYAGIDHEHAGYALSEHVHGEYAAADHTHEENYQPAGDYALAGHSHAFQYVAIELVNAPNGVAPLDGQVKVPWENLPDITKATVGLANVDNTSDADKPISTAQANAIDAKLSDAPTDGKQYARKDGAWNEVVAPAVTGNNNYSVPFGFAATPAENEHLLVHVLAEAVTFPANFANSRASIAVNPSVQHTIDVRKNSVSIGTITVATNGAVTFVTAGGAEVICVAGDRLTAVWNGTAGATIINSAFTLLGAKS